MNSKRLLVALVVATISVVMLLGIVVPGTVPEAQAQDVECPAGFALLDDGVTCESGPATSETLLLCQSAPLYLLDNGGQICAIDSFEIEQTDCPPGFSPDDSLGGLCAAFVPADQLPEGCPDGARGVVNGCYIVVAKGPRGTLVCNGTGTLAGDICVVEGEPPTRGPGTCPTGPDIVADGCYRLVSKSPVTLECPDIATEVDGECRVFVALIPGGLQCEAGFGLVGGRCIAQTRAESPTAVCPTGSFEDDEGACRRAVANAAGAYFCPDSNAALNGKSCVFTAPPVQTTRNECAGAGSELIGLLKICTVGELTSTESLGCDVGIVDVQRQTCVFLPAGSECPRGATVTDDLTCAFAPRTRTDISCDVGLAYVAAVSGEISCAVPALASGLDRCPAGFLSNESFGGVCTRTRAARVVGPDFCEDPDAILTSGDRCVSFAAFLDPTPVCAEGSPIDETGLCLVGVAQLDSTVVCAREGVVLDERGFCSFALDYATIEITKATAGDGPEEVFVVGVRDFEGLQEFLLAPGETVTARVLVGEITVSERQPAGWRLSNIACGEVEALPSRDDQARFSVAAGQQVQCVVTNVPAAATLTLILDVDADGMEPVPGTFGVRVGAVGQPPQDLALEEAVAASLDVVAGQVTVSPDFPLGWELAEVSCESPVSAQIPFLFRVTAAPSEAVECSLRAQPTGAATITITKEVGEGDDPSLQSDFLIDNLTSLTSQRVAVTPGQPVLLDVNPGAFEIQEVPRAGTEFVSAECEIRVLDDALAIVRSSEPWSVTFGAQAGRQIDCVFRSRSVDVAEIRFAEPADLRDMRVAFARVLDDQIPTRFDRSVQFVDAREMLTANPGQYAVFVETSPGLRVDSVTCSGDVVDAFDGDRIVLRLDPGEIVDCTVMRSELSNAPRITLVRELDGLDASPESGLSSASDLVIRQSSQRSTPQVGVPLVVDAIAGNTVLRVENQPGWQPTRIRCTDPDGASIGQGLDQVGIQLFQGDEATCTFTSRLISQADGAEPTPTPTATPTPSATPLPDPTATAAPTPTPGASGYETAAISYPANGFSLTPTPQPDEVLAAAVPSADTERAGAPLVATGTTAAPLVALALGLLAFGSCLHVAARRADA